MEYKGGTEIFTADNRKVGAIDRVVIDPHTKEVTHLVVRKGFLFKEHKVIPISLVAGAGEDYITLRAFEDELELPKFEETHYVPLADQDKLYPYPPAGSAWWGYPGFMTYEELQHVPTVKQNIPEHTVALKKDANVIDADGTHVGKVARIVTDSATDRATHIVVSGGLLEGEILIPTSWITTITQDEVFVATRSDFLKQLPAFERA